MVEKNDEFEEFKGMLMLMLDADSRLFFKLLISQGYDIQLTRATIPTHDLSHCGNIMDLCRNVHLLRQVLTLVEKHYCKENQVVATLTPSNIRISPLLGDEAKKPIEGDIAALVKKT